MSDERSIPYNGVDWDPTTSWPSPLQPAVPLAKEQRVDTFIVSRGIPLSR
jgi:hypothetical protein